MDTGKSIPVLRTLPKLVPLEKSAESELFRSAIDDDSADSELLIDPDSSDAGDEVKRLSKLVDDGKPDLDKFLNDLKNFEKPPQKRKVPGMNVDGTPSSEFETDDDEEEDSDDDLSIIGPQTRSTGESTVEQRKNQPVGHPDLLKLAIDLLPKVQDHLRRGPAGQRGQELASLCGAACEALSSLHQQQNVPPLPDSELPEVRRNLQHSSGLLEQLEKEKKRLLTPTTSTSLNDSATDASQAKIAAAITAVIDHIKNAHKALLDYTVPSKENRDQLASFISTYQQELDSISKQKGSKFPLKAETVAQMTSQLHMLQALHKQLDQYDSPHSPHKLVEGNRVYTDAAAEVFRRAIAQVPERIKGHTAKEQASFDDDAKVLVQILKERSKAMMQAAQTGSQPLLKRPLDTTLFQSPLMKRVFSKYGQALSSITPVADRDEKKLMAELIDAFLQEYPKADTRSGQRLLANAKSWVLNEQRNWAVIESEVLVPVMAPPNLQQPATAGDGISPVALAKVKTVTTPVGHVFNNGDVQVLSSDSPVTQKSFTDYQHPDPGRPGTTITTGRNSHATTEHAHGVNVAVTESFVGETQIFSGTRHGTLSAYEIYTDSLKQKSKQSLELMAKELMAQEQGVSRIYTSRDKAGAYDPTQASAPTTTTALDKEWNEAMKSTPTIEAFIQKATTDEGFCELLRRRVALKRAREVFLAEVLKNPAMQEQIRQGEKVDFNSISLITPDPLRNFLAKLMPSKFRRYDELTMRREEMQGWEDLREELAANKLEIDGKPVAANIVTFSIGVNRFSLGSGNWLVRALTSGWNMVARENEQALKNMLGDPAQVVKGNYAGQLGKGVMKLTAMIQQQTDDIAKWQSQLDATRAKIKTIPTDPAQRSQQDKDMMERWLSDERILDARISDAEKTRREAENAKDEVEQLGHQLADMWQDGSYRHGGDQPYKFASRLALLSFRLGAGTAFSCKSGKDRTAQLDLEIKLLAFQCQSRRGNPGHLAVDGVATKQTVLPPYEGRTDLDRQQLQSFIFQDESRTVMQRYNTGVEGSRLNYWKSLYDSFIPAKMSPAQAQYVADQFQGESGKIRS